MKIVRASVGMALLGGSFVLSCGPRISDTGYTGTWSRRGINTTTTISIVRHAEGYLFRWSRESDDGKLQVRCNWDGRCEELFDGELLGQYQMRAAVDEESGLLRVEARGRRNAGQGDEIDIQYTDELRVRRKGTRLVSLMIGKDGQLLDGKGHGKRVFEKVSDAVTNPPASSGDNG